MHRRVDDRAQRRDAAIKVTGHQIGRRDIDGRLWVRQTVAAAETINASMFEKAPDNRFDANIFRKPWNARPQAANSPHDEVDGHARGGRLIKGADHDRVDE